MKVMKAYIEKRGVFKTLYVDRASITMVQNAVTSRRCSELVKS
ncbi:mobile element protein [Vibrio variabilis]|uniref:Mobile element protein n=1 Tax=Vibrio variabilis TaxID=990271 RepID=A0ABQ0JIK8_9VIBR|nr:mobile element protein [Vibrio variabilis]